MVDTSVGTMCKRGRPDEIHNVKGASEDFHHSVHSTYEYKVNLLPSDGEVERESLVNVSSQVLSFHRHNFQSQRHRSLYL